ncbi:MAG: 2-amino-4-hydroxy-6-hydroxymethyldihydropteridine diphosphokinase [Lentisphaeria bacterium]|nr:MAG: 2-amino-4-hydroxy-6-hydroxymethyldihydropteridine diphosphokinase [Lentisphaeria bacterium]
MRKLEANGVKAIRQSRLHRTAPVDCVPGTPEFSNAALTGEWSRSAETLLELTQRLEREAGRPACHSSRESRTLDLDLILFGERCSNSPVLTLPHPRRAAAAVRAGASGGDRSGDALPRHRRERRGGAPPAGEGRKRGALRGKPGSLRRKFSKKTELTRRGYCKKSEPVIF